MGHNAREDNLHASILDRLIDYEPELSRESSRSQAASFREIKRSVIRDIENLLNAKRNILPVPTAYHHVEKSLFTFGLKDYSADSPTSSFLRKKLLRDVQKTLTKFEPRLRNVSVHLVPLEKEEQGIAFRISGVLVVHPIAEPVIFDTHFNSNRGEYLIEK